MGLFGNNNYNSRHARYDKTIGKPEEEQRREIFFSRGKGGAFTNTVHWRNGELQV